MKHTGLLMIGALTACAWLMQAVPAHAEEKTYIRPSDYITQDTNGNQICTENGAVKTGKFTLAPNYLLGDVGQDGEVNARDAAAVLQAASKAGLAEDKEKELLNTFGCEDITQAYAFADINEDGLINSIDAAQILAYAAQQGASGNNMPLGCACYYADENGILQTGLIQDGTSTYYADENYHLAKGWKTFPDGEHYFDSEYAEAFGWQTINEHTYYFLESGAAASGQQEIEGQNYYFDESHAQLTGFQKIGSKSYYFDPANQGAAVSGWQTIENAVYYFTPSTGAMQTGWLVLDGNTYYLSTEGILQTGLVELNGYSYFFDADGKRQSGWQEIDGTSYYFSETNYALQAGLVTTADHDVYYLDSAGAKQTGWQTIGNKTYYFDEETGAALSGWQKLAAPEGTEETVTEPPEPDWENWENWTDEDYAVYEAYAAYWDNYYNNNSDEPAKYNYYFSPEDKTMQTGFLKASEGTYYLDEDGRQHIGFLEYDGKIYGFDADGLLITNQQTSNGSYDADGVFTKSKFNIPVDVRNLLDNAERSPGIRQIPVYDRQYPEKGEPIEFTIRLSDKDYEIIEAFAAEHFSPDMTISERLYETWQWIHYNVDYAYAGELWNEIESLSYPDAIFNHKLGQCVQYNGAMAAVLAYYGYDVYMVKGWIPSQHYWTEVVIDGTRYYVETGNYGKNGSWCYFFIDANEVGYTKK